MAIQKWCNSCGAIEGEMHRDSCRYMQNLNSVVVENCVFVNDTPRVHEPPGYYTVSPIKFTGSLAGRDVLLELTPQDDLTPSELLKINDLVQGRVEGNLLAYILDMKLIRHFTEKPIEPVAWGHTVRYHKTLMVDDKWAREYAEKLVKMTMVKSDFLVNPLVNPPVVLAEAKSSLTLEEIRAAAALVWKR